MVEVEAQSRVANTDVLAFQSFDIAHDSTMNLPAAPALVAGGDDSESSWLLVRDLRAFVDRNRSELIASSNPDTWEFRWAAPSAQVLSSEYARARGTMNALRAARPTAVAKIPEAPDGWGLYRIHQGTGTWYVGISSNVRRRLYQHRAAGRLDLERGDRVDVLHAKLPGARGVVTWSDLQEAERDHIRRLKDSGEPLVNQVAGGNGAPPAIRFYPGEAAGKEWASQEVRAPGEVPTWSDWTVTSGSHSSAADIVEHDAVEASQVRVAELGIRLSTPRGEWALRLVHGYLGAELWAVPFSTSAYRAFETTTLSRRAVLELAQSQGKLDWLKSALESHVPSLTLPESTTLTFLQPTRGRRDDAGRVAIPSQALLAVTRDHVLNRELPAEAIHAGFSIDRTFRKAPSLNTVLRVAGPGGGLTYLKVEENRRGANAELLASLIWYRVGWPGITDRVIQSRDSSVLIVPPVAGTLGIADQGSFEDAFGYAPSESPSTLRCERAPVVKKLGIADLRLSDPFQVTRFVVTNALWGNSDRHSGNLNYGWKRDPDSPDGGYGYLLPLDHGRCFFNNSWFGADTIAGTPVQAVTGSIGNPHQLLRPFAELSLSEPEATLAVATSWAGVVDMTLHRIVDNDAWTPWLAELRAMQARARQIQQSPQAFIDACVKVVAL